MESLTIIKTKKNILKLKKIKKQIKSILIKKSQFISKSEDSVFLEITRCNC